MAAGAVDRSSNYHDFSFASHLQKPVGQPMDALHTAFHNAETNADKCFGPDYPRRRLISTRTLQPS